ncbi:phosphoadenylyl-sulfate reductase [uncultured Roseobacter sp.]|uniref:phosphoadenylyl-sulfate reductase n=1 Tax=uncultured Roseobacter sp. TaxID=114847 RepID=UPI00260AE371|nr:phosphoadenylyl-sulfate reductase [uncultured Roseobacter sp.]
MPLRELAQRRNTLHHKSDPQTILRHVLQDVQIGQVALVSSFGADSVVLLHMISEIDRTTPVIFLDTLMLFRETLRYQRDVSEALGLRDVRIIRPDTTKLIHGDVDCLLHQSNPDGCCALRKTEPLTQALEGFGGWITGRRRGQGKTRDALPLFELADRKIKINPLVNWGADQIAAYIADHDLPRHPLVAKGYASLGCRPCTTPVGENEDPRAGRWRGQEKTECGIHFPRSRS